MFVQFEKFIINLSPLESIRGKANGSAVLTMTTGEKYNVTAADAGRLYQLMQELARTRTISVYVIS